MSRQRFVNQKLAKRKGFAERQAAGRRANSKGSYEAFSGSPPLLAACYTKQDSSRPTIEKDRKHAGT